MLIRVDMDSDKLSKGYFLTFIFNIMYLEYSGFWISRFNNVSNWRKEYLIENFWFIPLTADATSKVFSSICIGYFDQFV